jgi:hypothetical protein
MDRSVSGDSAIAKPSDTATRNRQTVENIRFQMIANSLSRKEVGLGLADKEGGAHVDVNLSPRYRPLLASQQLQVGWNEQAVSPLNLSRYMTAQAAVELLDCLNKSFPTA